MSSVAPQAFRAEVNAIAAGSEASPAPDADTRRRIRDYFEHTYDRKLDRLRALRMSTRRRKLALGLLGCVLLTASIVAAVAGKLDYEWFRGREIYEIAAGAAAVLAILAALLMRTVEDLPGREQVEREVNAAREHDIQQLLASANRLLADTGQPGSGFDVMVVGYPDKKQSEELGVLVSARLGLDGEPRFTPATVTAMKLAPRYVALYVGTVDLTTGNMAAERLLELAYRDIVMLERSSLAVPAIKEREPGRILGQVMRQRVRQPMHDKDILEIHFANEKSLKIVLRDSKFADSLKGARLPLSMPHDKVEQFWLALRTKWHEAQ